MDSRAIRNSSAEGRDDGGSQPGGGSFRGGPRRDDPNEQRRKMFCGGLSIDTSKQSVEAYFSRFGPVQEVIMVPDSRTGRPRGFCFIIFQDESSLDLVLSERSHQLDGRSLECTRAVGREEVRNNPGAIRKTKRVYLARTKDLSENEIKDYFEEYIGKDLGTVEAVELMRNKVTNVHRGFGFINFSTFEAADKVCSAKDHKIGHQDVIAIKAEPKSERAPERFPPGASRNAMGYDSGMGGPSRFSTGGPSLRELRTIMAPNERMVAPALQASLAGRGGGAGGSNMVGGGVDSPADIRRLEEEIMIREEQLRIKEMKLQLQSARLAGAAAAGGSTGGGYNDRMASAPVMGSNYGVAQTGVGGGDYFDQRRSAVGTAMATGGGPMRTRDRYTAKEESVSSAYGHGAVEYSTGGNEYVTGAAGSYYVAGGAPDVGYY